MIDKSPKRNLCEVNLEQDPPNPRKSGVRRCYRMVETLAGFRPVVSDEDPEMVWRSRGYLPHFDAVGLTQFITYRLVDSFPTELIRKWNRELSALDKRDADIERLRRLEDWLDLGKGPAWLAVLKVATMVEESLLYFDGIRYRLHAWVIMPNHLHTLVTLMQGFSLSTILHSWRSYTAHEANKILSRQGRFWAREPFERFIRSREHFEYEIAYIEENPVKAGLCRIPEAWPFSSARYRRSDGEIRR